ncbi:hypothetical protein SAMN05443665_102471 [Actinomadura meyerae]|uniref:WD40-like Beta Propeller Repeat n=1 Tax=Actinomadura meyerae TaxID=240840 RepID=A0A239LW72_9ACTN|nr:hypothetical protein [Actinomadura meyerae]SNT34212.1 hypothetical protein SAMN05443665_102471 [Actinomadura meyerae]
MEDDGNHSPEREPLSWRVRRWAAPTAMALAVVTSIAAVQVLADDPDSSAPYGADRYPRFLLTVQPMADGLPDEGPKPWFVVREVRLDGRSWQVDSVERPPSAGEAQMILPGPRSTFVVAATRKETCESRFYRGKVSTDGRVQGIEPFRQVTVPALVAGLALSPDGDRLAYTTAPCTPEGERPPEPRANVTVLDIDSGHRRTWTTTTPSVIGEIVWARDGRTLGYAVSDILIGSLPGEDVPPGEPPYPARPAQPVGPVGSKVQAVAVHALDTEAPGTDLRKGRLLFRQSADSGTVMSVVMKPDGRSGFGAMEREQPPSTVIFSFSEGKPIRVTSSRPRKPNVATGIVFGFTEPRYACLNGLDSFGRVVEGGFSAHPPRTEGCGSGYVH